MEQNDQDRADFEQWVTTVWRPDDGAALLAKGFPRFAFAAWKAGRAATPSPVPAKPATAELPQAEGVCKEADGCPTEKAVLQRFWREHQAAIASRPAPVAEQSDLARIYDLFGIGEQARSISVLTTCISNVRKFADLLHAVEREFFMVPGEPDDEFPGEEPDDECLVNCWGSTKEQYIEQFRAALARIAAPVAAVPEGWKPVPIKPTAAMAQAARVKYSGTSGFYEGIYEAMIAAAPSQPDQSAQEVNLTCKGKGGAYVEVGVAAGAGQTRGSLVHVYRDTVTGNLFYRTPMDFAERMERIGCTAPAAPSAAQAAGVNGEAFVALFESVISQDPTAFTKTGETTYQVTRTELLELAKRIATTPSEGVAAPVEQQKLSTLLWRDLKSDADRANWLLMGRGYETGVLAHAIQNDVAMAYHRLAAQPSADQVASEAAVRDAALAECEAICDSIYRKHRDQYKGRGDYAPDNPRRADPHCDGCADGAAECEEAISKLRTTASGEKGDTK